MHTTIAEISRCFSWHPVRAFKCILCICLQYVLCSIVVDSDCPNQFVAQTVTHRLSQNSYCSKWKFKIL